MRKPLMYWGALSATGYGRSVRILVTWDIGSHFEGWKGFGWEYICDLELAMVLG